MRSLTIKNKIYALSLLLISTNILANDNAGVRIANLIDIDKPIPPYRWQSCQDKTRIAGSVKKLVEAVFHGAGLNIQWIIGNTTTNSSSKEINNKFEKLIIGDIDFIITPPDSELNLGIDLADTTVMMNTPLATHKHSLITKTDNPVFTGKISSLKPYTAGMRDQAKLQHPAIQWFSQHQLPVKHYPNIQDSLTALITGEVDYVVGDYYSAKTWAYSNKKSDQLQFHDINMSEIDAAFLLMKKGGRFQHKFDELSLKLSEYFANGLAEELNQLYLKQWITNPC